MSGKRPLVVEAGEVQQLQRPDDLDIPLADRVAALEAQQKMLVTWMLSEGFDLPAELQEVV